VGLAGDYNNNGGVDTVDYVVWRKGPGATFSQDDYNVWRAHSGEPMAGGTGVSANVAVPEPAILVMLIMEVAGWCLRRSPAASKFSINSTSRDTGQ